jgi:uncharacterized protein (DUF427 family)
MTDKQILIPSPDHPITVEPTAGRVTVTAGGRTIADSTRSLTLQEASYPAVQYLPLGDVDPAVLEASDNASYCPFKGDASYYSLRLGDEVLTDAVWTYADPHDAVAQIAGHVAFYPNKVDVEVTPA